jgi:hypothetical protein
MSYSNYLIKSKPVVRPVIVDKQKLQELQEKLRSSCFSSDAKFFVCDDWFPVLVVFLLSSFNFRKKLRGTFACCPEEDCSVDGDCCARAVIGYETPTERTSGTVITISAWARLYE